jgi:hypothetical protein
MTSSERELALAYSPCPNDTYIFAAWTNGMLPDAPPVRVVLDDVEALNAAARGALRADESQLRRDSLSARRTTASCAPAERSGAAAARSSSPKPRGTAATTRRPGKATYADRDPRRDDDRLPAAAARVRHARSTSSPDALRPHRRRGRARRGRCRPHHPRIALHLCQRAGWCKWPTSASGGRPRRDTRFRSARSSCGATSRRPHARRSTDDPAQPRVRARQRRGGRPIRARTRLRDGRARHARAHRSFTSTSIRSTWATTEWRRSENCSPGPPPRLGSRCGTASEFVRRERARVCARQRRR